MITILYRKVYGSDHGSLFYSFMRATDLTETLIRTQSSFLGSYKTLCRRSRPGVMALQSDVTQRSSLLWQCFACRSETKVGEDGKREVWL